jgi:hypothetical protein
MRFSIHAKLTAVFFMIKLNYEKLQLKRTVKPENGSRKTEHVAMSFELTHVKTNANE